MTLADLVYEMEVVTYEIDDDGNPQSKVVTLEYEHMSALAIGMGRFSALASHSE